MGNKKPIFPEPDELELKVDAYMNAEADHAAMSEPGSTPPLPPINIFVDGSPLDEGQKIEVKKAQKEPDATDGPIAAETTSIDLAEVSGSEATAGQSSTRSPLEAPQTAASNGAGQQDDPLVDDIIAHEGDQLLAAEDEKIARAFTPDKPGLGDRITGFFAAWWHSRAARSATIAVVLLGFIAAGALPDSRYFVLNTAGVRSKASITVIDQATQLPLKNVSVRIGESAAKTDQEGWVQLDDVKLGTQDLVIGRLGFAEVRRSITLGWGSNPLGEERLKAVGAQYSFLLTDYLSGKPVDEAEIASGEATARSDKDGKVVLALDQPERQKIPITVSAKGYRPEKLEIDADSKKATAVVMVSKRKNVFISKQSGKYDVYKIDIDGRDKKLLLSGSGLETERLSLVQHSTKDQAALVSNRDNKRNQDGFQLQTLTLINTNNGDTLSLDSSESIRIVDWIGDKLVYVKVRAGTSGGNPERVQLMSYDLETTAQMQLATANHFSDVVSAKGVIYYASSNNHQGGQSQFVRVGPDNTGRQVLLSSTIWTVIRSRYDGLTLNGEQGWYAYALGDQSAKKQANPPANPGESRFFLDSEDKKRALWTENRDGKGVLLSYDAETKKDTVLTTQSGLTYPLKWLDDKTVVYRVATPAETADYVISVDGGKPRKLSDVTNVPGFGRWFYY